jgi:hypothetical protein
LAIVLSAVLSWDDLHDNGLELKKQGVAGRRARAPLEPAEVPAGDPGEAIVGGQLTDRVDAPWRSWTTSAPSAKTILVGM